MSKSDVTATLLVGLGGLGSSIVNRIYGEVKKNGQDKKVEAVIIDTAADGNFYVQVTKIDVNAPAVLIYDVPEIAENYNAKFTNSKNFYNKAGNTVHGLVLTTLDVYELSAELFEGTPEVGKKVTISGRKHVVASV